VGLSGTARSTIARRQAVVPVGAGAFRRHCRRIIPAVAFAVILLVHVAMAQGEDARRPPDVSATRDAGSGTANVSRRNSIQAQAQAQREALCRLIDAHDRDLRPAESFRLFADDEYPGIVRCKYELAQRARSCFILDGTTIITKTVVPQEGQKLCFHVAAVFPESAADGVSVRFGLRASDGSGGEALLFTREWRNHSAQQEWQRACVDLARYVGAPTTLGFSVTTGRGRAVAGAAGVCLLSDPRLVGSKEPSGVNVILCSIETLRRDHLSLYGHRRRTSPFLEELAAESVVFEQAYSQSSWTRPSVASMLTGLYPSQHDARVMFDRLHDSCVLLPEILRGRGYSTAAFCTNGCISRPAFNYDQGYDLFVWERCYLGDRVVRDILGWLDDEAECRPFFVFAHLFDPHAPYKAPGRYEAVFDPEYDGRLKGFAPLHPKKLRWLSDLTPRDEEYIRARYDEEILYTDTVLRRLVEGLKLRGLWDQTLVVVTSDHGEEFREHGGWGHGFNLYPEVLRIPLLVKLPGNAYAGRRVGGPAGTVDIVPTILSALDMAVPDNLLGIDLLGRLGECDRTGRRFHFAEFWPSVGSGAGPPYYSVISDRYQYVLRQKGKTLEQSVEFLFDLAEDPAARHSLVASRPDILKQYAGMIRRRYRRGYTLVANAGRGRPLTFTGRVCAQVPIVRLEGSDTEADDVFTIETGRKSLRFQLTVAGDCDVLFFQTKPGNAPVTVDIDLDGEVVGPDIVFLGPREEHPDAVPVSIPLDRCIADTDPGIVPECAPGERSGIYIWRNGTPRARASRRARPSEETLQTLKDLGYL